MGNILQGLLLHSYLLLGKRNADMWKDTCDKPLPVLNILNLQCHPIQ